MCGTKDKEHIQTEEKDISLTKEPSRTLDPSSSEPPSEPLMEVHDSVQTSEQSEEVELGNSTEQNTEQVESISTNTTEQTTESELKDDTESMEETIPELRPRKKQMYSKVFTKQESTESDVVFECNICLDTASLPVVTLCGHLYCWPCLSSWLQYF